MFSERDFFYRKQPDNHRFFTPEEILELKLPIYFASGNPGKLRAFLRMYGHGSHDINTNSDFKTIFKNPFSTIDPEQLATAYELDYINPEQNASFLPPHHVTAKLVAIEELLRKICIRFPWTQRPNMPLIVITGDTSVFPYGSTDELVKPKVDGPPDLTTMFNLAKQTLNKCTIGETVLMEVNPAIAVAIFSPLANKFAVSAQPLTHKMLIQFPDTIRGFFPKILSQVLNLHQIPYNTCGGVPIGDVLFLLKNNPQYSALEGDVLINGTPLSKVPPGRVDVVKYSIVSGCPVL